MNRKVLKLMLTGLLSIALLSGCSTKQSEEAEPVETPEPPVPYEEPAAGSDLHVIEETGGGLEQHQEEREEREEKEENLRSEEQDEQLFQAYIEHMIRSSSKLGSVHLGDTVEDVIKSLGNNYTEEIIEDDAGFFPEPLALFDYEGQIELWIGKRTERVVRIKVSVEKFQTDLGFKTGDNANTVIDKYKDMYGEFESPHGGINLGWFEVEKDVVIIFDFISDDNSRFNPEITPESKVECIELMYAWILD